MLKYSYFMNGAPQCAYITYVNQQKLNNTHLNTVCFVHFINISLTQNQCCEKSPSRASKLSYLLP